MATRKSAKPSNPPPGPAAKGKPRAKTDWQAVERDYRTGKFTLRELGAKHGTSHVAIQKRSKKGEWTQDLAQQIRQATNARLVSSLVTKEAEKVTNTVLVAAEVNKEVILGHRGDLRATRDVATGLLAELSEAALLDEHKELIAEVLAGEGADAAGLSRARLAVTRAVSLGTRISSVKSLAEAFTKLQAAERVAFGLDEKDDDKPLDPMAALLAGMRSALPTVAVPPADRETDE